MPYPATRMRRLRRKPALRAMVRETSMSADSLLLPIFVHERDADEPIPAIPGHSRLGQDGVRRIAEAAADAGIAGLVVFGIPDTKDPQGSTAWAEDGIVQRALRTARSEAPGLVLVADCCLCQYTDHGHCGVLTGDTVDNDATLPLLAKVAASQAAAGADVVAPSDMMDGRIGVLRQALDASGCVDTALLSYSTKYASSLYGPFRDAAASAPAHGDRSSYQMDPANVAEGVREALLDVDEGADAVMVKPALSYLDVIARVTDAVPVPVAAYQVSGEFAMLRAAAERGWLDYDRALLETLLSIRRAGARMILTYGALDAARLAGEQVQELEGALVGAR